MSQYERPFCKHDLEIYNEYRNRQEIYYIKCKNVCCSTFRMGVQLITRASEYIIIVSETVLKENKTLKQINK